MSFRLLLLFLGLCALAQASDYYVFTTEGSYTSNTNTSAGITAGDFLSSGNICQDQYDYWAGQEIYSVASSGSVYSNALPTVVTNGDLTVHIWASGINDRTMNQQLDDLGVTNLYDIEGTILQNATAWKNDPTIGLNVKSFTNPTDTNYMDVWLGTNDPSLLSTDDCSTWTSTTGNGYMGDIRTTWAPVSFTCPHMFRVLCLAAVPGSTASPSVSPPPPSVSASISATSSVTATPTISATSAASLTPSPSKEVCTRA